MAKLRTNHVRNGGGGGAMVVRVGLFAIILGALTLLFNRFVTQPSNDVEGEVIDFAAFDFVPASTTGVTLYNPYFALSYSPQHKQAEWVAYELSAARLSMPWVSRRSAFLPDSRVKNPVTPSDYRNSGYDRGHLAPAADMAFAEEAMEYSFLMTNISPQAKNFNKGIWRELEELTRNWAKANSILYVVTGPVLAQKPKGTIGEAQVSVPMAYYKVLLDYTEPQKKGIGFIIPNEVSYEPLYKFAMSIADVERQTGLTFFPKLLHPTKDRNLKETYNIDLWEFSKRKYELRTQKWNQD